ncbi:hypothetical protein BDQ12DRAFT_686942 [Crucibulum laeve]|uniref:Uncharacterized protein n=1 Tax=Crucibulum laeve TaxID=68775 RepID=A0A5C3LUJ7_9AGAR|nr:hypothetical protein BDQ12DRAFT_686942 [Crucibulum laeve]
MSLILMMLVWTSSMLALSAYVSVPQMPVYELRVIEDADRRISTVIVFLALGQNTDIWGCQSSYWRIQRSQLLCRVHDPGINISYADNPTFCPPEPLGKVVAVIG